MPTRAGDITRLIATDLACIRGGRIVFERLSFAVPSGSALVLTGPNGAGKSSLLRVIAGLVRPSMGTVAAEGGDAEHTLAEHCHYAGHLDPVKASLSVGENLEFWRDFLGGEPARSIDDALAAVGLGSLADLPGGYLSAGQRRRLSLARLIAVHRPIWLLDEPTAALDRSGQEMFATLCAAHLAAGGIIVAATHAPLALPGEQNLALGGAA
ncbi:heme ABC exporter ATP-binding protein CcmA [Variibacter gotjawalensis]|nr:heme ABC exporter ATP-binding protein CcmA [Variibacter gotjawalensis]NIK48975.1 heme exporter protein A [Variibacter gotjawalensis]